MNWRAIRTITLKDVRVVMRTRAVLYPLLSLPIILLVILPLGGGLLLANADPDSAIITDIRDDMDTFIDNLPDAMSDRLDSYDNEVQRIAYLVFSLMFPPFFLILPTMAATVIAADSFAGEKERKTLESLIYTPTTDRELYIAKLLAPWLVAVAVAVLGFIAFALVVNVTTFDLMDGLLLPDLTWLIFVLWVAPGAAALGLGAMVLVSSRTSTFQEAYQLGGLVVLPVVLLIFGQLGGVIYFGPALALMLGLGVWVVALALIAYGASSFERGKLIAQL